MHRIILSILLTTTSILYGSGSVGAIFLLINPSADLVGNGGIGVGFPSRYPSSAYLNPANGLLDYNKTSFNFSFSSCKWLPNLASDLYLRYYAFNYARQLKGLFTLNDHQQLILRYHFTNLDLGEQIGMDEYGNPTSNWDGFMNAHSFTVGLRKHSIYKFIPPLSLGYDISVAGSYKLIRQKMTDVVVGEEGHTGIFNHHLFDLGILTSGILELPLSIYNIKYSPSIGFSKSNIGDDMSFIDITKGDPPPTISRLGYSNIFSIVRKNWTIFSIGFGKSASDLLTGRAQSDSPPYYINTYDDNPLGDIDIKKHIIENNYDESIYSVNEGREINFFGFIILKSGRFVWYDGIGYNTINTSGFTLFSKGLFNIIHYLKFTENPIRLKYNIDLQWSFSYESTSYDAHPRGNTMYSALSININDLDMVIDDIVNIFK